jgi:hypothetical protein
VEIIDFGWRVLISPYQSYRYGMNYKGYCRTMEMGEQSFIGLSAIEKHIEKICKIELPKGWKSSQ